MFGNWLINSLACMQQKEVHETLLKVVNTSTNTTIL